MSEPVTQSTTPPASGGWHACWQSLKRVMREPLGALGLVLVVFVLVSAIGADYWAPYEPQQD